MDNETQMICFVSQVVMRYFWDHKSWCVFHSRKLFQKIKMQGFIKAIYL